MIESLPHRQPLAVIEEEVEPEIGDLDVA